MFKDKYWLKCILIMVLLIVVPLITMGNIGAGIQFILMFLCLAGCVALVVLMSMKYLKGEYSKKEYIGRALSLYIPYLLFPLYTFISVWIYYQRTNDNDPLGYLWVAEVIPQTVVFFVAAGLIILVTNSKKKKSEAE